MAVYFNNEIRCYDDGRVERLFRGVKWREITNAAIDKNGYNIIGVNGKLIKRHRIIASCFLGLDYNDPTQKIDHINRSTNDNRVENLRIVTNQQNGFNRGAKGYYFDKKRNKWVSKISLNKKTIYLGQYDTEEEAKQAYINSKPTYHII
jgi:hypothetical protein